MMSRISSGGCSNTSWQHESIADDADNEMRLTDSGQQYTIKWLSTNTHTHTHLQVIYPFSYNLISINLLLLNASILFYICTPASTLLRRWWQRRRPMISIQHFSYNLCGNNNKGLWPATPKRNKQKCMVAITCQLRFTFISHSVWFTTTVSIRVVIQLKKKDFLLEKISADTCTSAIAVVKRLSTVCVCELNRSVIWFNHRKNYKRIKEYFAFYRIESLQKPEHLLHWEMISRT